MRCCFSLILLEIAPHYEAISYVWGDLSAKVNIRCAGKNLGITQNLRDILIRFRRKRESRLLWADTICINRNDVDERKQQASKMSKIYGNAERVLIWLGRGDDSDATVEFLQDIAYWLRCDFQVHVGVVTSRRMGYWAYLITKFRRITILRLLR